MPHVGQFIPWRISRLFCTLRHIPPIQAVQLLRARLLRRATPRPPSVLVRRAWRHNWQSPRWRETARGAGGSITFLGQTWRGSQGGVWSDQSQNRLWQYNLHYLDDLDARDGAMLSEARCAVIEDWISNNPPAAGAGWEPYPLSLRIVNLVKFASATTICPDHWRSSLAMQSQSLSQQIEWSLRANHLFENGKALVFAGSWFEGSSAQEWLRTGLRIVDNECKEQFLSDGGHFELSPMYHGTMVWNLCDLVNLAETSGMPELLDRAPAWRELIYRGLNWYAAMTHPDGAIAFFNDAAFGIAPDLAAVTEYAAALGITAVEKQDGSIPRAVKLESSGYLRIELGARSAAIIDIARIGPDYQPGHAHADTLSFELSLFGRRVLVNSGTSTYARGALRDAQRGTGAHNTVIVDNRNSSDTWAGFRVGRRATPSLLCAESRGDRVEVLASHDGYCRLLVGARHVRQWIWTVSSVVVSDEIQGRFGCASALYHLHPDVVAHTDPVDSQSIHLDLREGRHALLRVPHGRASIRPATWYPEFGRSVDTRCIVVEFAGKTAEVQMSWWDKS
jgi:uncharacterized heparinase superfamily protein